MTRECEAVRLLTALRAAGCDCFLDDEDREFYASPPARHIEWDGDPEEAMLQMLSELRDLLPAEKLTVH